MHSFLRSHFWPGREKKCFLKSSIGKFCKQIYFFFAEHFSQKLCYDFCCEFCCGQGNACLKFVVLLLVMWKEPHQWIRRALSPTSPLYPLWNNHRKMTIALMHLELSPQGSLAGNGSVSCLMAWPFWTFALSHSAPREFKNCAVCLMTLSLIGTARC